MSTLPFLSLLMAIVSVELMLVMAALRYRRAVVAEHRELSSRLRQPAHVVIGGPAPRPG
jgi:hypothetical protein